MGTEGLAWILLKTRGQQQPKRTGRLAKSIGKVLQKCIIASWMYFRNTKLHLKKNKAKKKMQ